MKLHIVWPRLYSQQTPSQATLAHWRVAHLALVLILVVSGCSVPSTSSSSPPTSPQAPPGAAKNLAVWTNNFGGIPFTMVGADPSLANSGTTAVTTLVVPVRLDFAGVVITPEQAACGDSQPAMQRVMQSPILQDANWNPQVFPTANTQFGDAFQRANFWSIVSKASPNYHVLLSPSTMSAPITVNIPPGIGAQLAQNPLCPNEYYGAVPQQYLDTALQQALPGLHATADELVMFITYDTEFLLVGGGTFVGYHTNVGGQTYLVASYMDRAFQEIFRSPGAIDTSVLSHEVGEWLDNPLLVNKVPAWGGSGLQTGCGTDLEVGDPLTGSVAGYTDQTGFTYHLQDLAYFSWFARNAPSLAYQGRYSALGTFSTFAPPCVSSAVKNEHRTLPASTYTEWRPLRSTEPE